MAVALAFACALPAMPMAREVARVEAAFRSSSSATASSTQAPEATVITGGYNFTRSAQRANAENVVVISGNRAVTDRFLANFERRRRDSTPWR